MDCDFDNNILLVSHMVLLYHNTTVVCYTKEVESFTVAPRLLLLLAVQDVHYVFIEGKANFVSFS